MSSTPIDYSQFSAWTRFWHEPLRAERLAVCRIILAIAIITDQLIQFAPYIPFFYGPDGIAPQGLHDESLLGFWRWTILIFNTDNLTIVYTLFYLQIAVAFVYLIGWQTRLMGVILYFLTLCFLNRNPSLWNGGTDTLAVAMFLLMLMPTGKAFSVDRLRSLKKQGPEAQTHPPMVPAWPVRILQIQLCMIYLTTGIAKLFNDEMPGLAAEGELGSWWKGTTIYWVLNDTTMGRIPYAQLPLPLWVTAPVTWICVWWEFLFIPLVIYKPTRKWALWFGVLFHLGIYATIEVGWFGFYMFAFYGAWIPGSFWDKWIYRKNFITAPTTENATGEA